LFQAVDDSPPPPYIAFLLGCGGGTGDRTAVGKVEHPASKELPDLLTSYKPDAPRAVALRGPIHDLGKVQDAFQARGIHVVDELYSLSYFNSPNLYLERLGNFFSKDSTRHVLYYTGHGEMATGDWCLAEKGIRLRLENVLDLWVISGASKKSVLFLIADCCFSGCWIDRLKVMDLPYDVVIQTSSKNNQTSKDIGDGSHFTKGWLDGCYNEIFETNEKISVGFGKRLKNDNVSLPKSMPPPHSFKLRRRQYQEFISQIDQNPQFYSTNFGFKYAQKRMCGYGTPQHNSEIPRNIHVLQKCPIPSFVHAEGTVCIETNTACPSVYSVSLETDDDARIYIVAPVSGCVLQ